MSTTVNHAELRDLCEAVVEGRLTAEQRDRLEALVLHDAEARHFYLTYLHQHASLLWSGADPAMLQGGPGTLHPARPAPVPAVAPPGSGWLVAWLAVAASLLLAVGWLTWRPTPGAQASLATLVHAKGCRWDSGTLPTETGARLGTGKLRLAEGLARITFDCGAEIALEGPAELELVTAKRCVLHGGRLVAHVPPSGHGFQVETPTALLRDFGTDFGVHVRKEGIADVQVFQGQVEAEHFSTGRKQDIRTGKNFRFLSDGMAEFDPQAETPPRSPRQQFAPGLEALRITTAQGRGRDAYVQPIYPSTNMSDILLLVKNTSLRTSDWVRKAYLTFDLGSLNRRRIEGAELTLTFAPTGMGFASECPDATFALHGLKDETLDDWNEDTVRWATAPGNAPGGAALDPERTTLLGRFEIAQGVVSGTRTISGPALRDFLSTDTNGLATFILVRETAGSGRSDLVHGFASRRHPSLAPPTLEVVVREP